MKLTLCSQRQSALQPKTSGHFMKRKSRMSGLLRHSLESGAGKKNLPVERVGLYIPGGSAPLFSTVLMLALPAQIAGCKEVILCTPPNSEGKIHPAILFAAALCNVTNVFKIGGIQAIGAMAYGTESVPKVHKIFGPGNSWVTAAKQYVSLNTCSIDMPAGPSELAVVADHSANPAFVASDLLSQAEHGADSQVVLITTDESMIENVSAELAIQLEQLPGRRLPPLPWLTAE